ncbi:hypothetical protein VKT23_015230 [Stygiomarasmius scandens]|uniref:Uncharacterized protein n=1 Tax=Marasmiellus scandens TaxID=2682957 RepID=A0ABR1J1P0_9AGAR
MLFLLLPTLILLTRIWLQSLLPSPSPTFTDGGYSSATSATSHSQHSSVDFAFSSASRVGVSVGAIVGGFPAATPTSSYTPFTPASLAGGDMPSEPSSSSNRRPRGQGSPPPPPVTGKRGRSQRSPPPPPGSNPGPSPAPPPDDGAQPPKKSRNSRKKAKEDTRSPIDRYHLRKEDLNEDETYIKIAFETHIHLLGGLHDQGAIPQKPSDTVLAAFQQCLETTADFCHSHIVHELPPGHTALRSRITMLRAELAKTRSVISKRLGRIEDGAIEMLLATLDYYHFDTWCPNLSDNSYTPYNMVHRNIAIETFRQAVLNHDYSFLAPINLQKAQEKRFLVKLYNNYVWSYFKRMYDKEERQPGAQKERLQSNKIISRRLDLAARRLRYVQSDGFPAAVRLLVKEPAAHSDDDDGNIHEKAGRSELVTKFLREVDSRCKAWTPFQPGRARERGRVIPQISLPSALPAPPIQVPIDWFDPVHFNRLPAAFRARYKDHKRPVALPGDYNMIFNENSNWKGLEDKEFMRLHGNKVLEKYRLPSKEEMKNMREAADEMDEDEDDDDDDDDDDEDALLFAFLSGTRTYSTGKGKGKGKARADDEEYTDPDVEMGSNAT